jgi:hypothetical protein
MKLCGNADQIDAIFMDHGARPRTIGKAVTVPIFDRIFKGPEAFACFGVVTVEGFLGVDGMEVKEFPVDNDGRAIRFAPRQFENLLKSAFGKFLEKWSFLRRAIVPWPEKPGPIFHNRVLGKRLRCLVELHRKGCFRG